MPNTSETERIVACGAHKGIYCPRCGGGWPGTFSTSEQLTKAALKGKLVPGRLGCATLEARAKAFIEAHPLTQKSPA